MKIDFAAKVDIGPRETNDDRVLIGGRILDQTAHRGEADTPLLAVVCDGCGGYAGGGIAAATVLESLSAEAPDLLKDPGYLAQALERCQKAVYAKQEQLPHFHGMCTTVAGCLFLEDGMLIFHAGDSRVYRYDGWCLARMTRDHSVVQDLVDRGQLTEEEALASPKRNVITRCIGMPSPGADIYISHVPMRPGEKYLFCSDGLWESLRDDRLRHILSLDMAPEQTVDLLIREALENGGDDNISACICAAQGAAAVTESTPFILD